MRSCAFQLALVHCVLLLPPPHALPCTDDESSPVLNSFQNRLTRKFRRSRRSKTKAEDPRQESVLTQQGNVAETEEDESGYGVNTGNGTIFLFLYSKHCSINATIIIELYSLATCTLYSETSRVPVTLGPASIDGYKQGDYTETARFRFVQEQCN